MHLVGYLMMLALCAGTPSISQRKAVLDALRPRVEAKLGPNIEFVVQVIRIENGWAFVMRTWRPASMQAHAISCRTDGGVVIATASRPWTSRSS